MSSSVSCSMTGSGSFGNILPGWSISRYATPFVLGDKAGGIGGSSFYAKRKPDSLFALNNSSKFVFNNDYGTFGHSGKITNISSAGETVSVESDTIMSRFDTEEDFPEIFCGNPVSVIDLGSQLIKQNISETALPIPVQARLRVDQVDPVFSKANFYSLAGHGSGFDIDGNLVKPKEFESSYTYAGAGSTKITDTVLTYVNSIMPSDFNFLAGNFYSYDHVAPYAKYVRGETPLGGVANKVYYLEFNVVVGKTGSFKFYLEGGPNSSITNTDRQVSVTFDAVTSTLTVSASYRSGGVVTDSTSTVNLWTGPDPIDGFWDTLEYEYVMRIAYGHDGATSNPQFFVDARLASLAHAYFGNASINFTADAVPYYYKPWTLSSNTGGSVRGFRNLITNQSFVVNPLSLDYYFYYVLETYYQDFYEAMLNIDSSIAPPSYELSTDVKMIGQPVIGGTYNIWQHIQDACSALNWSIDYSYNTWSPTSNDNFSFYFRKALTSVVDANNANYTELPSLSPSSVLSASSVEVEYSNASVTTGSSILYKRNLDEVYSAYDDNNRIISVQPGETISTTVKTSNYFRTVFSPTKSSKYPTPKSYYGVCDSTGANVSDAAWKRYGGSVIVTINENDSSSLDIKVVGPTMAIPGKSAPYSIAYSSGEEKYAALSVVGSAIKTDVKSIEIKTGVVESIKTQKTSAKISNKFIGTLDAAYDRGAWVAQKACGPSVQCSLNLQFNSQWNSDSINGRFLYNDSIYKFASSSTDGLSIGYNADWAVTVGDFTQHWGARTVDFHDDLWANNEIQDQIIAPFMGVDKAGVYLIVDTDGAITWTMEEFGDSTFMFDTDGVPYVVTLGSDENNILLYLDDDFAPYYV